MKAVIKEGQITGGYSPAEAVFAGIAASEVSGRIIVGRSEKGRSTEMGVISGLLSGGSSVISLGRCLETELFFASRLAKCGLCIYIKDEPLMKLDIREKGGLPLSSDKERIISEALSKRRVPDLAVPEGMFTDGRSFREIYRQHIEGLIPENCPYNIK